MFQLSRGVASRAIRSPFLAALLFALSLSSASQAQEFGWAPDFPVGATIPDIGSQDQDGNPQNFESLRGENGLVFLLSRSFDW